MDGGVAEGELLAIRAAGHGTFLVEFYQIVKDLIENVGVEDSNREQIANKVQGVHPAPRQ